MSPIPIVSAVTLEVIGAQLSTESGPVDCFSVYCPRGDCPPEDLHVLLNRPNPFIIAGDFNAHHSLWESNSIENTAAKSIYLSIHEHPDATILTPKNIGTRINPATGKVSTIDLIIASSYFGLNSTITQGPYSGSDHLPIITTLNSKPVRQSTKPPSWIFDKSKWPLWNSTLGNLLIASSFPELQDPAILYEEFMNAILASSYSTFRKSSQSRIKEPRRPWWNDSCQAAVSSAKQAEKERRRSPLSPSLRAAWKKAEALKKRTIINSKKQAWSSFISSLDPRDGQRTTWSFMRAMIGNGNDNYRPIPPLKNSADGPSLSTNQIADMFLDLFGSPTDYPHDNATLEPIINSSLETAWDGFKTTSKTVLYASGSAATSLNLA